MRAIIQSWLQINALQGPPLRYSPRDRQRMKAKSNHPDTETGSTSSDSSLRHFFSPLSLPFPLEQNTLALTRWTVHVDMTHPCTPTPISTPPRERQTRQRERESRDRKNASSRAWTTSLDGTHIVESRPPPVCMDQCPLSKGSSGTPAVTRSWPDPPVDRFAIMDMRHLKHGRAVLASNNRLHTGVGSTRHCLV